MPIPDYITKFIKQNLQDYTAVTAVMHDASTRRYYRVTAAAADYILCFDEHFKTYTIAEYPFLNVQKLFKENKINVPDVIAIDQTAGLILQQDFGDMLLQDYVSVSDTAAVELMYKTAIQQLMHIQMISANADVTIFTQAFDVEKLLFECNFFLEHCIQNYYNNKLTYSEHELFAKIFMEIANKLYVPDLFVLNHRDFHSRNLMITDAGVGVIDFQDARLGLPQYDLVSLLYDPYCPLDASLSMTLKEFYYHESKERGIHSFNIKAFNHYYNYMAFQRLIKAIGTYSYQTMIKQSIRYKHNIAVAVAYIEQVVLAEASLQPMWNSIKQFMQ